MQLRLCRFPVGTLRLGERTELAGDVLCVAADEIRHLLLGDVRLGGVDIDVAAPGEDCRIMHVLDVVEPRTKVVGPGAVFPGILGDGRTVGSGTTHCLTGVAVVSCAEFKLKLSVDGPSSMTGPRNRVIDMAGPAAAYSPFSTTRNLVLTFHPAVEVSEEEFLTAIRSAGLKVAEHLARSSVDVSPASTEIIDLTPTPGLPHVVYIQQLLSGGFLRNTYLYGEATNITTVPTVLHPAELADGALVNQSLSYAGVSTYAFQNNQVIQALLSRHGRDLNFAGVVLSNRHYMTDTGKRQRAWFAAKLAKQLGAAGAVLTQEGGGNSIIDQMLCCQACEQMGIRTVVVSYEMGGAQGGDFPLIFSVPEAQAIVSTGNREMKLHLPRVGRALGGDRFLFCDTPAVGPYDTDLLEVAFATDLSGFWRLRGDDYGFPLPPNGPAAAPGSAAGRPVRLVHFLNQFFAGRGGEAAAQAGVAAQPGPLGPGLALARSADVQVVGTVSAGDNYVAENLAAAGQEILAAIRAFRPDAVIAGPAFSAGRYGLACAQICRMVQGELGIPAITGMFPENPGAEVFGGQVCIVETGERATGMEPALRRMASLVARLARGEAVGPAAAEGYLPGGVRRNRFADEPAGERAAAMLVRRLTGQPFQSELAVPAFDRITAAPPADLPRARVALVTTSGLVPRGNPDRLPVGRSITYGRYSHVASGGLAAGAFECHHAGFETRHANLDPNRAVPLDIVQELARTGGIGALHPEYFTLSGQGVMLENAKDIGRRLAAELREKGVTAAILTAT